MIWTQLEMPISADLCAAAAKDTAHLALAKLCWIILLGMKVQIEIEQISLVALARLGFRFVSVFVKVADERFGFAIFKVSHLLIQKSIGLIKWPIRMAVTGCTTAACVIPASIGSLLG